MAKFCMKKIVLALAGIGLTGTALASITPNSAFSSPTPVGYGWHIALLGDWMTPSTSNLQYSTTNVGIGSFGAGNVNFSSNGNAVEPNYSFGYGGEIGYQIAGTMDDFLVSGTRFNNHYNNTAYAPSSFSTLVVPGGYAFSDATGRANFSISNVDAEFGHTECIGNWVIRPYAGVDYATITDNLDVTGSNEYNVYGNSFTALNSDFHGVGPEIGVNAKYQLGYGFGLVGSFNGELLVGNLTDNAWNSTNTIISGKAVDLVTNNTPDEEHIIVPGADAKAGLSYDLPLNASSCLTLEAGYEVTDYIHASARPNSPSASATTSTTSVTTATTTPIGAALHSSVSPTKTVVTTSSTSSTTVQFPGNFTSEYSNQDVSEHGPYVSVGLKF